MRRNPILVVCLSAALGGAWAGAQSSSGTVAYVYVANSSGGEANEISAFAADGNGELTRVPGSPFMEDVDSLVVNGTYLMAASRTTPNVESYRMEGNGALRYTVTTNYERVQSGCGGVNQMVFDHTGQSLYLTEFDMDCANNGITNWSVDKPTGGLNYLGPTDTGNWNIHAASFIGNNEYAYTAYNDSCMYYSMNGFKRQSNGVLTEFTPEVNSPTPPSGVRAYIPYLGAADRTNHVAFFEYPANPPGCVAGARKLATYTANAKGYLSTTSTWENMATTAIQTAYDMKMSPSGRLLAVAGQEGLQVFHFNGAGPITHFTPLLTRDPISQMFWDNDNHLYAITGVHGSKANRLYVFTVTATGYREAPGSPRPIDQPQFLIVQPR
jgi:hypothetical protein